MPIIHIHAPIAEPPEGLLESMCTRVAEHLKLPDGYMWAMWHEVKPRNFFRPDWVHGSKRSGPIAIVYCKSTYTAEQVATMLSLIRDSLVTALGCESYGVFVGAQRVNPGEVANRDIIWTQ